LRLETAVVSFVREAPVALPAAAAETSAEADARIDLLAAVHVADPAYYAALGERFPGYESLLFELVLSEGAELPGSTSTERGGLLSGLVERALGFLGFVYQTDAVDYTAPNFVHADLSPLQMLAALEARGEDALTLTLGVVADLLREQNRGQRKGRRMQEGPDLLDLILAENGTLLLKRTLAEELAGDAGGAALGPTLHALLVEDRNAACMEVLEERLEAGERELGIFYGAAHMPDFARRLAGLGFVPARVEWLTAWDLREPGS
jgi:hypothetical protein